MINGSIIIIDDDEGDRMLFEEVFASLNYPNKLILFEDSEKAVDYFESIGPDKMPFLIISDINMPKLNGFELRNKIQETNNFYLKSIPYILFSTAVSTKAISDAYSASVQGFFVKSYDIDELKDIIKTLMEYWKRCVSPNHLPVV